MEQIWALYAIGALITVGLGDFIKKLVLNKGGDKDVFLFTCFLMYVPVFWINAYFQGNLVFDENTLRAACIIGMANFGAPLGVMTALKYLNVSFALVAIRVTSSFLVLFIGLYILGDSLSIYNILGFLLGAFAIFLLSGLRIGQKIDIHPKGIIAVFIAIIAIVFGSSYYKYMIEGVQVHDYTAVQFTVTGLCLTLYMIVRGKLSNFNTVEIKKIFPYSFMTIWLFVLFFLYFMPNMYLLGPLSLSYKMLSYSLVVPIILSVVFLGEPINKTRIFAFGLTIVSIFLFLV
ncbi:EamA family transporter [Candidatus Gracilibacteria bacterium]|nr:EamA family transporter [Candidatus Gracilibacteria bacterium]